MTQGLNLTPVGFEPFKYWAQNRDPEGFAVQGIARELFDAMVRLQAVLKPVWDAETCKYLLDRMISAAGVQVLYHAMCLDVIMQGDRVTGALLATRAGLWRVQAQRVIDCSGDGEVFAKAGAAFDIGRESDGRPQPMALVAMLGGLDLPVGRSDAFGAWMASTRDLVAPRLDAAWLAGKIPPVFAGIFFPRVVRGGILGDQAWSRLVPIWADPTDPIAVSEAQVTARENLFNIVEFLRNEVPGFARAAVLQTSTEAWARESRRLRGLARLSEEDVRENRRQDSSIGHGCGFLEAHSATPGDPRAEQGYEWIRQTSLADADVQYDIAYGCLVPERIEGLLVAGRCLSATHMAQSSARMQITCMAMGQAAGTAAALGIANGWMPAEVPIRPLQDDLRHQGAKL